MHGVARCRGNSRVREGDGQTEERSITESRFAIGAVPSLFATQTRVTVQRRRMTDLSHRNFASREKRWDLLRRRSTRTSPRELVYSKVTRIIHNVEMYVHSRKRSTAWTHTDGRINKFAANHCEGEDCEANGAILVANRRAPRDPTKAPSKGPLFFPSFSLFLRRLLPPIASRFSLSLSFSISFSLTTCFLLLRRLLPRFFIFFFVFFFLLSLSLLSSSSSVSCVLFLEVLVSRCSTSSLLADLPYAARRRHWSFLDFSPSASRVSPHLRYYHTNIDDSMPEKLRSVDRNIIHADRSERNSFFASRRPGNATT